MSFLWGSVASQFAMDSAGTLTCLAWNGSTYANFRCLGVFAQAADFTGGNVQANSFNGYGLSGDATKPGANQIIHSSGDTHTYTGYINSNIPDEGIAAGHFYVSNGSDNFIRKTNTAAAAASLAQGVYAQTCTGNINILHSGTTGVNMGTAIAGGQYGSIYWVDTDASINIYHSAIGHALKIRMGTGNIPEYYFPNMRGDIGPANSGRLYRVGNTLMIS